VGKGNLEKNVCTNVGKRLMEENMNQEIYNEFKFPDIITVIRVRRFEWLGHVVRMENAGTVQRVMGGKPGGGRTGQAVHV
jgi:hypothetical protein